MKRKFFWGFLIAFIWLELIAFDAEAAGQIKQDGMAETTANITWTAEMNEVLFDVYIWIPTYTWKGTTLYTDYTLKYLGETTDTRYYFTDLTGGEQYDVAICSYDVQGNPVKESRTTIETLPGKGDIWQTKLKWSSYYQYGQNVTMTYNLYIDLVSQSSVDGYEIRLYNQKGKCIKKKKVAAQESSVQRYTFYSLKDNFYSVKVRAYKKFNGKTYYGKWSDKSYALRQPKCAAKPTSQGIYVRWETVKGATGYDIYMCTEKLGEYKKVASTNSKTNMVLVKKLGKKKFKKGKMYYYYVVAKKKIGKKTYESALSYRFKVVVK